mgnify:CR=1 FL=1|tara:strand:- start:991 stop:1950 length:960 start_codon:yes stop_codon:yes gene_type:complete
MYSNILWIFSSENPMSIPSYIVGGIMPADYLKIKKVIYLKHNNARKFLLKHKPKIIILSKALHNGILDLAKEAKFLDIKIISIFDDWHFENTKDEILDRSNLNRELTKLSKIIIAKTDYAAKIIKENTKVLPKVIPDCIRYKTLSPINSFKNPINVSWFGNYTNHKTVIKAIDEILLSDHKINLQIITNKIEKIKNLLKDKKNSVSIKYFEWSLDLHKHIENSDIVILPLFKNNKSGVKSSNRIVDSLNMGRFVIVNENEQFKEFNKFCFFGNIGLGLNWIKNNEKEAIKKIVEGQKYVIEKYHLNKICSEWEKVINNC